MTKEQAKNLFGKRYKNLCEAMGYAPSTVSEWPENLSPQRTNEVIGCCVKMGINVPLEFLKND